MIDVTRPAARWFVLLDGGLVALAVLALSPRAHAAVAARAPLPSRPALLRLLGGAVALHVGEGLVAGRVAARHGLPVGPWAGQTLVVGFPSLRALRRTVRSETSRTAVGPPRSSSGRHT